MEINTSGPPETQSIAQRLGELATPGTLIVLSGPLGAGKTSFVQGLARGLGIAGPVNSPTFTLLKEYHGRLPLFHFDLYRLGEPEELWELGFAEYLEGGGVCALEWGERFSSLPPDHLRIYLDYAGENRRLLRFLPVGEKHGKLAKELWEHAYPRR